VLRSLHVKRHRKRKEKKEGKEKEEDCPFLTGGPEKRKNPTHSPCANRGAKKEISRKTGHTPLARYLTVVQPHVTGGKKGRVDFFLGPGLEKKESMGGGP